MVTINRNSEVEFIMHPFELSYICRARGPYTISVSYLYKPYTSNHKIRKKTGRTFHSLVEYKYLEGDLVEFYREWKSI